MDLNEEEISKMYGKLSILSTACEIKDLGYKYKNGNTVILDILSLDGYSGISEIDVLISVLEPLMVYGGSVEMAEENIDLIEALGMEPSYQYDSDEDVSGYIINISNSLIEDYCRIYNNEIHERIKDNLESLDMAIMCSDSSIDKCQVKFVTDSMYIAVPDFYIEMDTFLSEFVGLIVTIHTLVEKEKKEAA